MAKGLCCAAQTAGDLGKPLIVNIRKKDGTMTQRCGVCEVVPSCRNPQKLVFAFRFLASAVCGLAGARKCTPTTAGIAEYRTQIPIAAGGRELLEYNVANGNVFQQRTIPGGGRPYMIPQ